jgi:hypothetical protein
LDTSSERSIFGMQLLEGLIDQTYIIFLFWLAAEEMLD